MSSPVWHAATTRLTARPPYAPDGALGHLVATSAPGCEEVRDGWYRRAVRLSGGAGIVAVRPDAAAAECRLWLSDPQDETEAVDACRRLLDLDAAAPDPADVVEVLTGDPALRPVVESNPGQRLPRCTDAAEMAVRAVLGQQVSTGAARTLAGRLVHAHGTPLPAGDPDGGLSHLWPSIEQLLAVDPADLAMPGARRRAFTGLVRAIADGQVDLTPGADLGSARRALADLPGIGPWTVELVALRGLGDPDAFPVTDLGVRAAAERLGLPSAPRALARYADRWRPYRGYATQHLWSTLDHEVNRDWRARAQGQGQAQGAR